MSVPRLVDDVIEAFMPARDRWPINRDLYPVMGVCLHTPEMDERPDGAEALGRYFANPGDRTASTHHGTDPTGAIRYADDDEMVAGARGGNQHFIHIEIVGRAGQSAAQWRDEFSIKALRSTAKLVAVYCTTYDLPVRRLTEADVRAGNQRGITDHATIWRVHGGDVRTDPGEHFPWGLLLRMVKQEMGGEMEALRVGRWWELFRDGDVRPDRFHAAANFAQIMMRRITDSNGLPYYGSQFRIDGRWGPKSKLCWTWFEKDQLGHRKPDGTPGEASWHEMLREAGLWPDGDG